MREFLVSRLISLLSRHLRFEPQQSEHVCHEIEAGYRVMQSSRIVREYVVSHLISLIYQEISSSNNNRVTVLVIESKLDPGSRDRIESVRRFFYRISSFSISRHFIHIPCLICILRDSYLCLIAVPSLIGMPCLIADSAMRWCSWKAD